VSTVSRVGGNASDGVAHGSGGSVTSVGVGTGGMVRSGSGDEVEGCGVADGPADGSVVGGAVDGGAADGVVVGGVVRGRVGRGENSTAVTGVEGASLVGAVPMLADPRGCSAATGPVVMGVASIQPVAMARGSPTVRSPKRSGLGDNRTS
jgi:hypothetical protein